MKHTKRFLVAIALLLATLLISGLALASSVEEEATIKSIELKLAKTEYEKEYGKVGLGDSASIFESAENRIVITPTTEGTVPKYQYLKLVSSDTKVISSYSKDYYSVWFQINGVGKDIELKVQAISEYGEILKESAPVKVTVKEIPVDKIIYNEADWGKTFQSWKVGRSDQISEYPNIVTVLPSNATFKDELVWTTKDTGIIRLSKDGYLVGLLVILSR